MEWARARAAEEARLSDLASPVDPLPADAAGAPIWPDVVCLASDTPGRWTLRDAATLSRRWPLAAIVSVATSLADGRRRSGPPLPGIEEVAWNDLPGRLAWWFSDLDAGRPGTLGLPATARREDRVLDMASRVRTWPDPGGLSVAARRAIDAEGIAELLAAAGHTILRQSCGRPPLDEPADVLVWDVDTLEHADLVWLRMLAANRPGLAILLLDSFPQYDTILAATQAGAAAVLARPVSLESLAGTLLRLKTGFRAGHHADLGADACGS